MTKIIIKNYFTILALILVSLTSNAQLYGGIEIGGKGIKMSVLDVDNIKRGDYKIISYWVENAGISKGISIDGNLAVEDMEKAGLVSSLTSSGQRDILVPARGGD